MATRRYTLFAACSAPLPSVSAATIDKGIDAVSSAGDLITAVHTITNTGNTCLRDVEVSDLDIGGLSCSSGFEGERLYC